MRSRAGPWWLLPWALLAAGAGRTKEALGTPPAVPRCRALKEMDVIKTSESDCYCYHQKPQIEWKYIWSTVHVKIASADLLSIVYITDGLGCRDPETVLSAVQCAIHMLWTLRESHEIAVNIRPHAGTVCFSVKPAGRHSVHVTRSAVDFGLVLLFVAGIALLRYAARLSRSPAFCYSLGTALGVLMTPVFLLLLVRRSIPKYSTFGAVMAGCWFASVYMVCQCVEHLPWLWCEHRTYVVGYVLAVGSLSFAACYKHGPPAKERSRCLLAWTLRLLALALTHCGAPVPQAAWAAVGLMLLPWVLHFLARALRNGKKWLTSRRLAFRYLTEEEYREQAEAETARALGELRQACRRPDFPSWLAVSRLQAPRKFADFVLGGSHLSPEEMRLHEEQYSLGGTFLEEQLFHLGRGQPPECLAPAPAPTPCPLAPSPPPSSALAPSPPPSSAPAQAPPPSSAPALAPPPSSAPALAPSPPPSSALALAPPPSSAPAQAPPPSSALALPPPPSSALALPPAPAPACHSGPGRGQ